MTSAVAAQFRIADNRDLSIRGTKGVSRTNPKERTDNFRLPVTPP